MTDLLRDLSAVLNTHDLFLDLFTVWTMVVCFAAWGISKGRIFWSLRTAQDKTRVGTTLKHGKGLEAAVGMMMSLLYGLTLAGFYFLSDFDVWSRLFLRLGVVISLVGATFYSLRLDYYIRNDPPTLPRETKDTRDLRQDTRSEEQDERGEFQDQRGWEQSRENLRMDARSEEQDAHEHELAVRDAEIQPS